MERVLTSTRIQHFQQKNKNTVDQVVDEIIQSPTSLSHKRETVGRFNSFHVPKLCALLQFHIHTCEATLCQLQTDATLKRDDPGTAILVGCGNLQDLR